jgi:predicted ribosome quality control (RQC) complex YloA/Tae2 family protein
MKNNLKQEVNILTTENSTLKAKIEAQEKSLQVQSGQLEIIMARLLQMEKQAKSIETPDEQSTHTSAFFKG